MKNSTSLLLATMLRSTGRINVLRFSKDKKKRGKIIGAYIGLFFLYAMLIGYSVALCIGYGKMGLTDVMPDFCALTISLMAFILTFFKTNGYLFNFREYDMLMALPFTVKTVVSCKFLYMYIKSLPLYFCISISALIGYAVYAKPGFFVYPLWLLLTFFLPVIPTLLSSFIGFLIARVSAGFKYKKLVQTLLTFVFVIFCFSIRYIIEALIRGDKVKDAFETTAAIFRQGGVYYPPAGWFSGAVRQFRIADMLLLVGVTILLFEAVFLLVSRSYRQLNSALDAHSKKGSFRMKKEKRKSILWTVCYKEFRRMMGSTNYLVNGAMGIVLMFLFSVAMLIFGPDKIIGTMTNGAPVPVHILDPAIPFIVYFFIGMVSTPAMSPSLEGKSYWIVQSLPISKKQLYQGKMLFNMVLTVPGMLLGILCFCISEKIPLTGALLFLVLGVLLCAFSTAWGCVCGIKHMRLDWENEIEVIKQSAAVAIYMFPNMILCMILVGGMIYLGTKLDYRVLTAACIPVVALAALLSYLRALKLAERSF